MVASHASPYRLLSFLYDLLDVLICGFDNAIHLRPVRGRIMVLDLELHAQCGDHIIVEIRTIVCDDPLWDTVPIYEILFDESGHNILGYKSEGSCLNPLREVVNGDQDEVVFIGSCRFDFSGHINTLHCEWPGSSQDIQRNWRYMHFVSIDLTLMTGL